MSETTSASENKSEIHQKRSCNEDNISLRRILTAANSNEAAEIQPNVGDPILVFKPQWFDKIFGGEKDLEIRHQALTPGLKYLSTKGVIYGKAMQGVPIKIKDFNHWNSLRPRHLVPDDAMFYNQTYALLLLSVERVQPLPYQRTQGPIGNATYRPFKRDLDEPTPLSSAEDDGTFDQV